MATNGTLLTQYEDAVDVYRDFLGRHVVWSREEERNAFDLFQALKALADKILSDTGSNTIPYKSLSYEISDVHKEDPAFLNSSNLIGGLDKLLTLISHQEQKKYLWVLAIKSALIAVRDKIHAHNMRLVFKILYKVNRNHKLAIQSSDLINDGNMGLMRAMESFRPELGYKFSTYAYQWVEAYTRRAVSNYRSLIKVPHYLSVMRVKMHGIIQDYSAVHGKTPSHEYLANATDIPLGRIEEMLEITDIAEPFDSPTSEDNRFTLSDIHGHSDHDLERYERGEFSSFYIKSALGSLTERQKQVITMRYGLNGGDSMTRALIADQLSLSNERIRQIEAESLTIVKDHLERMDFEGLEG